MKLADKNFRVAILADSPQTGVRFYSSPDTTEFLTVVETPWRNCCASQELSAGWNHEVSRCHSSFRREASLPTHIKQERKKKKKDKCHHSGVFLRLSSDGWRQVWSRRLWARLIVDDSARDHPQFVASLTLWRQLPGRNQWRGGSVTELTNLPLTGCQQCGRCHRHSHLSAGLSSTYAEGGLPR